MDVPLDNMPQAFDSACCLILTLTASVLCLINNSVYIKIFAIVIPSPKVCEYFSSLLYIIPNHLGTSYFSTIFHHKCSNIFGTSFIKTKHPDCVILATFGMMGKLRFIDFDCTTVLTELVFSIMVLEIYVNKVSYAPVYIINICILKLGNTILHQISVSLKSIKASGKEVK